jgi:hypothetical protein
VVVFLDESLRKSLKNKGAEKKTVATENPTAAPKAVWFCMRIQKKILGI